ncbi:hypothetical protein V5T82_08220 [Magnetovibrio sp. PR-2]|uniref:hypothetical protein n=1 Tax=Magnetovibrio sp. PR-2 TaxID=3120356 RepID=UPI002FCE1C24
MKQTHSVKNMFGAVLLALSVCILIPSQAAAEYCWAVGCENDIGWIAINKGQIYSSGEGTLNWEYQYDPTGNVFKKQGLPDVNSIAITQRHGTPLLLPEEKVELNSVTPEGYRTERDGVIDREKKKWKDKPFPRNGYDYGFPMADGTKVKILGYDFTDKGHLFALVIVVEDGGQ